VAFLKNSGLSHFEKQLRQLAKEGIPVTMVVGLNFAITEPSALERLSILDKKYPAFRLFLCRLDKKSQAFHPKIYASRKGKRFQLLSGSANLTNGGLNTNHEASIFLEGNISSEIWKEVSLHFQFLISNPISEPVNKNILEEYAIFYEKAKRKRGKEDFEFDTTPKPIDLNTQKLNRFLTPARRKALEEKFKTKERKYKKAATVLNQIADLKNPNKSQILDLFFQLTNSEEEENLFDSGGIPRHKNDFERYYKSIFKLIQTIRENRNKSAGYVFEAAFKIAESKEGIGVNLITEIMMSFDPERFAVLNKRPLSVLTEISGKTLKKTPRLYTSEEYQNYCNLMFELNQRLGFKNMLQTDAFCNSVYEEYKAG
jgi:HKD family nuclease